MLEAMSRLLSNEFIEMGLAAMFAILVCIKIFSVATALPAS
tara:strand:+ start:5190 stop:5312 length:123 start_codon:yes stop_codon:yes gene_type:complete